MKEIKYDKEMMDQYIALKCYELSCEPISEEDRLIIADSLDFQAYCFNEAWNEFVNEMKKSRIYQMINWLASKKKVRTIAMIIFVALMIAMCIEGVKQI